MIIGAFRQLAVLLALALIPAVGSAVLQLQWHKDEPLEADEVRPGTARMWGDHVLWVDARSRHDYHAEHVPGAVLLNAEEWDEGVVKFLADWDAEKTVVVYSAADDRRSRAIAERLVRELKIESVYVLKGGFPAWRRR